jgi:hypothetical protein
MPGRCFSFIRDAATKTKHNAIQRSTSYTNQVMLVPSVVWVLAIRHSEVGAKESLPDKFQYRNIRIPAGCTITVCVRERIRCVRGDVVVKLHLPFVDFSPQKGVHKRSCIARSWSRPRVPYILPFDNSGHRSYVLKRERANVVVSFVGSKPLIRCTRD